MKDIMTKRPNYIELSSVVASVKRKDDATVVQISDAGATFYLTEKDWKLLKQYVDKQLKKND